MSGKLMCVFGGLLKLELWYKFFGAEAVKYWKNWVNDEMNWIESRMRRVEWHTDLWIWEEYLAVFFFKVGVVQVYLGEIFLSIKKSKFLKVEVAMDVMCSSQFIYWNEGLLCDEVKNCLLSLFQKRTKILLKKYMSGSVCTVPIMLGGCFARVKSTITCIEKDRQDVVETRS